MGGIRMSLTNDETIFPNAPPMITPTAMYYVALEGELPVKKTYTLIFKVNCGKCI